MITKIVAALKTATGLPVKPLAVQAKDNCIVYNLVPQTDDGAVATDRLELRLITQTYEEADRFRKLIIETLVNTGDNIKISGILNCDMNGGGQLKEFDTNTIHTIMYFDLTYKTNSL